MSMYWDKKKDTRLISFLYNSIFFTGVSLNNNLELIFNSSINNLLPIIDNKINLSGLDEMSNTIDNIMKASITNLINRQPLLQVGMLSVVINNVLSSKIPINTLLIESNLSDILVKELRNYFYKNTLKDNDFDWISIENKRLVDFVWTSLRMCSFGESKRNVSINYELDDGVNLRTTFNTDMFLGRPGNLYRDLHLEINPPDLKCKLESIHRLDLKN